MRINTVSRCSDTNTYSTGVYVQFAYLQGIYQRSPLKFGSLFDDLYTNKMSSS